MRKLIITFCLATLTMSVQAQAPAFPGAEGHGRYITGGRGGKVIHVTNLNDSGTGSFRAAVSGSDKKIVVFDVGGVIALKSNLNIGANTTIEGQTAPAPGITLRYYTVNPNGNNIIMRFIRIRRGQEKDVNDGADASTARHFTGMMLDHCSFSWSIDEVASFYDNNNFTMQWCTIGESLCNAGHNKGAHGYGGIWGGKLASFHHNLILHVNNRSPRFNGARYDWTGYTSNTEYRTYQWKNAVQAENVDFRNCVIFNTNGCYGGPGGGQINMVGNYYKSGPAATINRLTTVTVGASGNAEGYPIYWDMTSRYFLDGNLIDNKAAAWDKFSYDNGTITRNGDHYSKDVNHYYGENQEYLTEGSTDYIRIRLDEPAPIGAVTTHDARTAFTQVLGYAGASLHRDDVDARYVQETTSGTVTYSGSVTKKPGRIDVVSDVNGYTEENFGTGSRPAGFDTDNDGMPDEWELKNGLDPAKDDSKLYTLDPAGWYTNIEVYCNSLVQDIMIGGNGEAQEAVKEYYPAYTTEQGTAVEALNQDVTQAEPEPEDGYSVKAKGDVLWSLDTGNTEDGVIDASLSGSLLSATMAVGANLSANGTKTLNGVEMTKFQAKAKETGAGESNAVKFVLKPGADLCFIPRNVSFCINRDGTDSGVADVTWQTSGKEYALATGLAPDRSSFTAFSKDVTGVDFSLGDAALVINIYGLNANKSLAIGNVVISGKVTDGTLAGISSQLATGVIRTEYYNMQGVRVASPVSGSILIETRMLPDGTRQSRKQRMR